MATATIAETTLPRRSLSQPHPYLVEGGDCGACALGGLIGLPSPADVYALFGETRSLQWTEQRQVLCNASSRGLVDRLVDGTPLWPHAAPQFDLAWGLPGWWCQSGEWFRYVRMAMDAGYYGVATVAWDGGGPRSPVNHAVLLCGARERQELHPSVPGASSLKTEILVSCSARGGDAQWVGAHEFLRDSGGFNVLLARPARERQA